jgi:hypothetical protein
MTTVNDIVLVHFENQPATFARIESITPDAKADWYHVELLFLQIPLQRVTWILRNAYIEGDPFTMGGKNIRLERIPPHSQPTPKKEDFLSQSPVSSEKGRVISLSDIRKK